MKIIGFAQLRNEKEKGNLENWFACMNALCDKIYIYDQNSTDGSQEYYKQFDHVRVIENTENGVAMLGCKAELLDLVKEENEEGDWIFWLDGDTLVERRFVENPQGLKDFLSNTDYDSFSVGHYNLWRSDLYYRTDDLYDWLNGKVIAFWKLTNNLSFPRAEAYLHYQQYPEGMVNRGWLRLDLIHRGFSTDYQLITRYDAYKALGETGWKLDRMLNEKGLVVEKLDPAKIPEFAPKEDNHPSTLQPLIKVYNESK